MNLVVQEALETSKNSTKQNRKNFVNMKSKFWKLVGRINRDKVSLSNEDKRRLSIAMSKMR